MGERTQALIEVNVGTETKASFSLHYQWGYGRAMLMDLLHIAIEVQSMYFDKEMTKERILKEIASLSHGCMKQARICGEWNHIMKRLTICLTTAITMTVTLI